MRVKKYSFAILLEILVSITFINVDCNSDESTTTGIFPKTYIYTRANFEAKCKEMTQMQIKGMLGVPDSVGPTGEDWWTYNIGIRDEMSKKTFISVTIFFNDDDNSFSYCMRSSSLGSSSLANKDDN
jgi:hypothetical protein